MDEEGRIHCSLLLGKSRANPKEFVSIPRLELTAAVLSVKMACLLKKELNLGEVNHYFWTDSKVVLGYIRNDTRRFKTFAANRIYQIKENTNVEQWSYIPTRENPADDASTGLNAEWESPNSRWFQGPSFLWQEEEHWPNQDESVELATENPELRKETKSFATVVKQEDIIGYLEERISNWSKFKRIIALLLCYKRQLLQHIRSKQGWKGSDSINCNSRLFNLEELKGAEKEVIKSVQQRHFKEEIMALHNGNSLKSSSKIVKLDPFLDQDGILKAGVRIGECAISDEIQHPTLLPKSCKITELIIRWCHDKVAHAGRGININQIRSSGFWMISCNSFVRSVIGKCVRCKQLRGQLQQKKMVDLTKHRMCIEPPFTYCSVDIFGSFVIKDDRKEVKKDGALYTCLSSSAIHIEVVHSLSTDSFILSLRRFIGEEGW